MTTRAVNKRVIWLQKFFDELQRDRLVRSIDFFVAFFSVGDRGAFERKKKEVSKLPNPRVPQEVKHFGGKVNVAVTEEKVVTGKNIASFAPLCQSLYDKLIKANEDTVKIMRVLAEAFNREADIYKDLAYAYASIEVLLVVYMYNIVSGNYGYVQYYETDVPEPGRTDI